MATCREWFPDTSSRGHPFMYCNGKHVNLTGLKEDHPDNPYLRKQNIPNYPNCVFSASKVCHVTNEEGLHGILKDGGFRGNDSFLWWDLSVTADDYSRESSRQSPDRVPYLENFTTSPAFQSKSRYGNFRFTFNLRELLNKYSKQYCERTAPILRKKDTQLYKKEIVYSVLVHPRYMTHYKKYPRLPVNDNHLCGYSQGEMSWHCQSPSDNYEYSLEVDEEGGEDYPNWLETSEYFVWDHVSVSFHMKKKWVLHVSHKMLFDRLSACEMASRNPEMSVEEAEAEIEALKNIYLHN